MKGKREIYCPHCACRPQPEDRWECTPGCGTLWNTFWTGAVCPGCGQRWPDTECLACGEVSLHEDWYHYPDEDETQEAWVYSKETVPIGEEAVFRNVVDQRDD